MTRCPTCGRDFSGPPTCSCREQTDEFDTLELDTGEEYQGQYDDDPNPYHGDYSEE
jgi:hypothetical protein